MKFLSASFGLLAAVLVFNSHSPVDAAVSGFVKTSGRNFVVGSCTKYFSGSNSYYLSEGASHSSIDKALSVYSSRGLDVLRVWGFCESSSSCGTAFVTFDTSKKTVSLSSTGLEKLDYVISAASALGIRVILPLTNNWEAYGGMDQWVKNLGGTYHDDFYTSSTIKTQFKAWIKGIANRVNSVSGLTYKSDPAIFAWELANEPRCSGSSLSTSGSCKSSTITSWASEISKYIKSVDSNHLVAVGDEGFGLATTSTPPSNTYVYQYTEGLDFKTNLGLSTIDFGTFHLYPVDWSLTNLPTDGTEYIKAHATVGKSLNKPVILEEFGIKDSSLRSSYYGTWYQAALDNGIAGVLFWMTAGSDYSDYDGFTLYNSDIKSLIDSWTTKLKNKNSC